MKITAIRIAVALPFCLPLLCGIADFYWWFWSGHQITRIYWDEVRALFACFAPGFGIWLALYPLIDRR